ncbi:MAG: helix-turn-helix transcriptional regulator [Nannocystaceae bacterium]
MDRTPAETAALLGARVEALRLARDWKRTTLAERSGVSAASIKRFEITGQVSLDSLLKIALVLGRLREFEGLLADEPPRTIADLDRLESAPKRQRGRR